MDPVPEGTRFFSEFLPSGVEVSRTRCTIKAKLNMQENVGNSPSGLREFCQPLYRISEDPDFKVFVFTDLMQTDESGEIIVPFSCHYFLQSTAQFLLKGKAMVDEEVPFAKCFGDATHDKHKKLNKLLLGFAGTHFAQKIYLIGLNRSLLHN